MIRAFLREIPLLFTTGGKRSRWNSQSVDKEIWGYWDTSVGHVALRAPNLLPRSVIHLWQFHTFSLIPSLKLTLHLKMDGWKTSFLFGRHIFGCELLVSGRVFLEKDHETQNTILLTSLMEVSNIIWDSSVNFNLYSASTWVWNHPHHPKKGFWYGKMLRILVVPKKTINWAHWYTFPGYVWCR